MTETPANPPTRVFISYSHDSDAHRDAVEALSAQLRASSFDARIDLYEPHPAEGWPAWMEQQLNEADFIIMVCSPGYLKKFKGGAAPGSGRGVRYEASLIRNRLYRDENRNATFIPVVFCADDEPTIPEPVAGHTSYTLDEDGQYARLCSHLNGTLAVEPPPIGGDYSHATRPDWTPSQHERHWLNRLLNDPQLQTARTYYVPVAATEQNLNPLQSRRAQLLRVPVELLPRHGDGNGLDDGNIFADALDAFRQLRTRDKPLLALLGEPGAGKTFALERIAIELAEQALDSATAPIPLFIRLNQWTEQGESLDTFLSRTLGSLGDQIETLRDTGRAMLLLDAINELPTQQQAEKSREILRLVQHGGWAGVVISCRERDFTGDLALPLDRLNVQPLNEQQIRDFLHQYLDETLGAAEAENAFWRVCGGGRASHLRSAWEKWQELDDSWENFWASESIPPELQNRLRFEERAAWAFAQSRRSLRHLASAPFQLMLVALILDENKGELPTNRVSLFNDVLHHLHRREAQRCTERGATAPVLSNFTSALQQLAYALQCSVDSSGSSTQTRLRRDEIEAHLGQHVFHFALDTRILVADSDYAGFAHQLQQEALAGPGLLAAIKAGTVHAKELWPDSHWWQRNGWEETLDLLGEAIGNDDKRYLIEWLGEANPDLASTLSTQWSVKSSPDWIEKLNARWFHEINGSTHPAEARAAAARALGRWNLDNRPGIGLNCDGLPDTSWVFIPEAYWYRKATIQPQHPRRNSPFFLSRYLITNAQYQSFVDDSGYTDTTWWEGLEKPVGAKSSSAESNSPRDTIDWFEAIAFCRWLSNRLGLDIRLPTSEQLQRAARGPANSSTSSDQDFPWHGPISKELANYGGNIGRSSAPGIYSQGNSLEGVADLSGNLFELTNDQPVSEGGRVLNTRFGGAWNSQDWQCHVSSRHAITPIETRNSRTGFRICCIPYIFDRVSSD